MFTSEALVIFTKEDGSGWELSEGDEIQISSGRIRNKGFSGRRTNDRIQIDP